MDAKRFFLVILLLVIGCQPVDITQQKSALMVEEAVAEAQLSKQLKINRDALLKGSSEQIRIDAATVMLFSDDPLAREILLGALKQTENSAARIAVCKALSQARTEQKSIRNKENFISSLFDILNTEVGDTAKLASEAILIFDYEQISKPLERMVTDPSLLVKARLNAIYALRLQPDMRAVFKLIELLDDPESQVAAEAEKALRSLGTPIGKDAETRKQIRSELKRKGRDEFFRDLLIRQEAQMRKVQKKSDLWQEKYLASLEQIYSGISDDKARGQFLAQYLVDEEEMLRLWALEKVHRWRLGTKSRLPPELGPILVNLISDASSNVRLKTAKLLSLMGGVNSAEKLLKQLEVEQNDEVKTELFVALGAACYYAFLPDSEFKILPELRKQALEWAQKYLAEQDPAKTQKGAEVIKKLLAQNGLASAEVDRYLGLLADRYKKEKNSADGTLRGELLSAMASLCAQGAYKAESDKLFKPIFEEALRDGTDLVREAAVDGLIYIDKAVALKILRKDFVNDSSSIIRKKLIDLAGEVGAQDDLVWLAEKLGPTAEGEPAWQAMLKIFRRSDCGVLGGWFSKFDSETFQNKLSEEQTLSFLEIAERKAAAENKPEMLKNVKKKLVQVYTKRGDFEHTAEYLGMLHQLAQTAQEKEAILADLLDVYLRWPNVKAATQLVHNCLLQKDLEPNNVIVVSIETYLSKNPASNDPKVLLEALVKIKTPEPRPMWSEKVKSWVVRLGLPQDKNKAKQGSQ